MSAFRGVARNLLRGGTKERVRGPPGGSRNRAPVGVWGKALRSQRHVLNMRLNISIEHHKSRILFRVRLYFEKNSSYDGGTVPHVLLVTPWLCHAVTVSRCVLNRLKSTDQVD